MQIGYHRLDDDSVNSGWYEDIRADWHLHDLVVNPLIDSVWIRAHTDGQPFYIKRNSKTLPKKGRE